jgi:hypothetical protein
MGAGENRGQILIITRPSGREHGRLVAEHFVHPILRRMQKKVDPDRLVRDLARPTDHRSDLLRRNERRADDPQTPSFGNVTYQVAARVAPTHPRRCHRVIDTD